MSKIALIGAGNFGFALTAYLDRINKGEHKIFLYDHRAETVDYIRQHRTHPKYYPVTKLSSDVILTNDLNELLGGAEILILAMVSTALEEVLDKIKPLITQPLKIVSVMKALDDDTGKTLTQITEDRLAGLPITPFVLVGGTTGKELVQEQYLGMNMAGKNLSAAQQLAPIFARD
ncbi:MAG: NAD(P)-binding domain-containing protein, partial [bacterium]|nr:NAD(P)-binding domain-containing protein [bacterium]